MNYKSLNKLDFKYYVLSTFHRGLFWGVIVSWTAVISSICGAAVTKALVVDRSNIIVARNYATVENSQFLGSLKSSLKKQANSTITPVSMSRVEPSATEFSFVTTNNFMMLDNYQLADRISFPENFAQSQFSPSFDLALMTTFNSSLPTNLAGKVQDTKITIQNTTNNPELANQVYAYLQERNFSHIAIAKSIPSNLSQTIVTTQSENLEAANYLKNVLNLGILDVVDNQSFDGDSKPELIIYLGEDAQSFTTNHNFIN
jgi:hypothetical protein